MQTLEVISIETIETKFSKPVMVGSDGVDKKSSQTSFNTITFEEGNIFGFGLILDKKKPRLNWGFIASAQNSPGLSKELAAKILEHAIRFSNKNEIAQIHPSLDMYYVTINGNKSIYLESTDIVKNIRGYAGEINVGIIIDENGFLKQVEHISSKETQSYLSDIKKAGFYEQFKKITITNGEQQIDAITGATLTSEAIANTVSQLIKQGIPYPISNYTDVDEVNLFSLEAILNSTWIWHITVIFFMFLFAFQKKIKKSKKTIVILSLLSVLYIGFFLNNSFTYISFIHPFVGTSISSFVGLYSLFVLLGAIWGKNTYCKYVCPFGNVQRLIMRINPKKTRRNFFISNKWIKRIRATITIVLLTGVLLGMRNWSNFELFPDLFGWSTIGVWFIVSLITILITMIYPMIWCRLLCPTGSLLDGISDLMSYKTKIKKRNSI
ncbi:4Fe-4S binding protein [Flavicella sp.]|uniref:4Fe-4S binding protein n=1 Tax=Flavicella sp. TaxID=2957742 RepID=UPI00301A270E